MTAPLRHFILTGALLATLTACKEQQQQMPPPPEVGVLEAKQQTAPLEREMVGRLSAFRSADVRARVPGVLLRRVYQEGTDVKEGQVLFLIDPAPLQATLNAAQSQLAQAEASYANAKMIADRARQLAPQKFVSQNDLDNAIATERTTAAAVQGARADVANAKINLEYASVRAPISGRAGQQQVTEGALVGQGDITLLTTIDQLDPLYVNFSMSVNELAELRRAQGSGNVELANVGKATVQIMLSDGSMYDQTGTVDFSDVTVDPTTGSVSLRALLPNPNRTLLPGSFVTIKAQLGMRNDVFIIPQAAIQRDALGAYAMVVGQDGNVIRKNVVLDGQKDGHWLITDGLTTGDRIIVSGLQKVKEGDPAVPAAGNPSPPANEAAGSANGSPPQSGDRQAASPASGDAASQTSATRPQ